MEAADEPAELKSPRRSNQDFTNPTGNFLGAFQAAMLYDTVGPALLATLGPDQFQSTLELNVHFLRPVRPERVIGTGRVVHRHGRRNGPSHPARPGAHRRVSDGSRAHTGSTYV